MRKEYLVSWNIGSQMSLRIYEEEKSAREHIIELLKLRKDNFSMLNIKLESRKVTKWKKVVRK